PQGRVLANRQLHGGAVAPPVELLLELADVGGEVALLLAEPLLELDDLLLARLELVLADLEVGLEARLARLDLGLALVDLAQARMDRLLGLDEPLLLALDPLPIRRGGGVDVAERSLALRQLALPRIDRGRALFEVVSELGLGAGPLEGRLAPVELGLARSQRGVAFGVRSGLRRLPLARCQLPLALRERGLALVEEGHPLRRGASRRVLAGGQLLPEALGGRGELLLLRVELAPALGELLVAPGELRVARPQLLLALRQRLVAILQRRRPGDRGLGRPAPTCHP